MALLYDYIIIILCVHSRIEASRTTSDSSVAISPRKLPGKLRTQKSVEAYSSFGFRACVSATP